MPPSFSGSFNAIDAEDASLTTTPAGGHATRIAFLRLSLNHHNRSVSR